MADDGTRISRIEEGGESGEQTGAADEARALSLAPKEPPPAEEVVSYIESAPAPIRQVLLDTLVYHESFFSGPVPPPSMLAQYERASPGLGTRLVQAFEDEGAHRRKMDEREISIFESDLTGKRADRKLGMWMAFVLSLAFLVGGVACIVLGHDWAGTALTGGTLGSLVTTFVLGKRREPEQELPPKRSAPARPPKRSSPRLPGNSKSAKKK